MKLTLSLPTPLRLYTLPYWSNPPFLIFDIRALWRSGLSARVPECQKIKNGGLDQYGAEPFEQQQFGTVGAEGVKACLLCCPASKQIWPSLQLLSPMLTMNRRTNWWWIAVTVIIPNGSSASPTKLNDERPTCASLCFVAFRWQMAAIGSSLSIIILVSQLDSTGGAQNHLHGDHTHHITYDIVASLTKMVRRYWSTCCMT